MSRPEILNNISTWRIGRFIDQPQYKGMSEEEKKRADREERRMVRMSPLGNAICMCNNPADARWIAERLNIAARYDAHVRAGEIPDLFGYDLPYDPRLDPPLLSPEVCKNIIRNEIEMIGK